MPKMADGNEYEILSGGERHRCGNFPKPKTFDQYLVCSCGTLFRSNIVQTYCEEDYAVYLWEKATRSDVSWSISKGRLDPKYRDYLKKNKKKWWQ